MLELRQTLRVEWNHCDPARIVFNPNYYIWMDQGTHHLLRVSGFDYLNAVKTTPFLGCPLVTSGAEFKSPCRFWDVLEMRSKVTQFGKRSFTVGHEIYNGDTLAVVGHEVRVWGWAHPDDPEKLTAIAIPDEVKTLLSVDAVRTLSGDDNGGQP